MAQAQEKKKIITKFEDFDIEGFVNIDKARRAYNAVYGGAKGGSAELVLAHKIKAQAPELSQVELVKEVYLAMYGLFDKKKAEINRTNEKKEARKKASR